MPINPDDYIEREEHPSDREVGKRVSSPTPSPHIPSTPGLEEGDEGVVRASPPSAPSFSPPPSSPKRALAGEGVIKLLDGLVELTTGVPPQIPASLRQLTVDVLESLDFPSGLPTHRLSPSARWKWGLGIIGAYTALALLGSIRIRKALARMQAQTPEATEPPQEEEPAESPPDATAAPFAEVPLPEEEPPHNIENGTQTINPEVGNDPNRDDSRGGPSA